MNDWERYRMYGARQSGRNRWGIPHSLWRTMTAWEQREIIEYQLHPRREGRDELADHRREGGGEWRPLVRG